ncbi:protein ligase MARCH7 [Seminavis robusta]|uniref:Protein ligase MARCH7 n=1 Tax=Seminavis robusta TaxID=568900 RepID=A0A9N8EW00_9STRA|nr:protein ligase MARCH7 [Seminavis robusta]|eukprot:Sro2062_g313040.1 protein ligase MARCH7 (656) ;mRNA; f:5932-8082
MGTSSSSNAIDGADAISPTSRRSSGNGNRSSQNAASPAAADAANNSSGVTSDAAANLARPYGISERSRTLPAFNDQFQTTVAPIQDDSAQNRGRERQRETVELPPPARCINPASDVNARLDTQVEVRVYPCNNNQSGGKKKFTTFTIKPEGVIVQGSNRNRNTNAVDIGAEYAMHVGRKLQRYELSDTRACQLLVTTHAKSFWVVPAPEAFSRHSGTCRLLGDRKHPPAPHTLQVGDFLRVGSVGVVVIETHDGVENRVLSEEKIQKIMKDTTNTNGGFLDLAETDGENSDDSMNGETGPGPNTSTVSPPVGSVREFGDNPVCYMCFDEEDSEDNPLITPCKCSGDTKYVHVECLRKWHTAEADNQICFLSSVDATCSVCKSTFKSDFKLKDGRHVKLFKSSLEPPYVSLLVATKHEMAQRLFNTRFQLSFSTLLKPDGRNATRPLLLGRSSGSDMVLDYRTVSARHAAIRFKNGEFVFTDAGSSNGSYLYLRRPLELSPSQPVQFRLGRSMISMKVVNKWNRRLLRAVRRTGQSGSNREVQEEEGEADDRSIGSNDDDIRITDGKTGLVTKTVERRTRDSVMRGLPPPGQLSQQSAKHLDLLYALAYPKREVKELARAARPKTLDEGEGKSEDNAVAEIAMPLQSTTGTATQET